MTIAFDRNLSKSGDPSIVSNGIDRNKIKRIQKREFFSTFFLNGNDRFTKSTLTSLNHYKTLWSLM